MPITASDVIDILGPTDEATIAEIVATGASRLELAEALAWISNDEALIKEGRPLPTGKVAEVCALLDAREDDADGVR